jgi:ABC-type antimicrobial peptide transport system permease subunit
VGLVARKALALVLAGAALGLPAALGIGRLISAQVPGVGRVEAVTIASAIALMVVVALMAAFLPARRASRVQPMEALRYE